MMVSVRLPIGALRMLELIIAIHSNFSGCLRTREDPKGASKTRPDP